MYTTDHARLRFLQRVKGVNIPKRNKVKFMEAYVKRAFKEGLVPKEIDDTYLRDYMNGKLKQDIHYMNATKITHYKNNLFIFRGHLCITILEMPEKAQDSIDNSIYITKLKTYANHLKEKQNIKTWLLTNGRLLEKTKDLKRCIINIPRNLSYKYIMNNFPMRAILYIKNDSKIKDLIIKNNKKRAYDIKMQYYLLYALLLIFPKNQLIRLWSILKNNEKFNEYGINKYSISKKRLELAYKQLYIVLGGKLNPTYSDFNIRANTCYDLIVDHIINIMPKYMNDIKLIFKDKY